MNELHNIESKIYLFFSILSALFSKYIIIFYVNCIRNRSVSDCI